MPPFPESKLEEVAKQMCHNYILPEGMYERLGVQYAGLPPMDMPWQDKIRTFSGFRFMTEALIEASHTIEVPIRTESLAARQREFYEQVAAAQKRVFSAVDLLQNIADGKERVGAADEQRVQKELAELLSDPKVEQSGDFIMLGKYLRLKATLFKGIIPTLRAAPPDEFNDGLRAFYEARYPEAHKGGDVPKEATLSAINEFADHMLFAASVLVGMQKFYDDQLGPIVGKRWEK